MTDDRTMSQEEVERIAHLARLEITPEERAAFTRDLTDILTYVNMLGELNTADIEATFSILPQYNIFRDDEVQPSLPPDDILHNAPDRENNYFKMPKIL